MPSSCTPVAADPANDWRFQVSFGPSQAINSPTSPPLLASSRGACPCIFCIALLADLLTRCRAATANLLPCCILAFLLVATRCINVELLYQLRRGQEIAPRGIRNNALVAAVHMHGGTQSAVQGRVLVTCFGARASRRHLVSSSRETARGEPARLPPARLRPAEPGARRLQGRLSHCGPRHASLSWLPARAAGGRLPSIGAALPRQGGGLLLAVSALDDVDWAAR